MFFIYKHFQKNEIKKKWSLLRVRGLHIVNLDIPKMHYMNQLRDKSKLLHFLIIFREIFFRLLTNSESLDKTGSCLSSNFKWNSKICKQK